MDEPIDGVEPQAHSQIIINGMEYSPEDAQSLIDLGKKTREYEQKWNTPVDRVWPEYGKILGERSQWQTEKQRLENQVAQFQSKQQQGTDTEVDLEKAKAAARQLGITLNEDLDKGGYIKKTDLEQILSQRDEQQKAVKAILDEAEKLEKEIAGTDAPIKFNKKAVLAYAQAYGISDLRKAYEEMNEEYLKPWKEAQIQASKNPGLKTLKPIGAKKEPEKIKINEDNVTNLLREKLWGAQ